MTSDILLELAKRQRQKTGRIDPAQFLEAYISAHYLAADHQPHYDPAQDREFLDAVRTRTNSVMHELYVFRRLGVEDPATRP